MHRIAFLITRSDHIGGSHVHVRDLAYALQKDGFDVKVFMGGDGPVVKHFRKYGLSVENVYSLKKDISIVHDFKSFRELRKKLKDYKPDIVATHSAKIGFIGRLVAKSLKIPTTFTSHCWSFDHEKGSFKKLIFRVLEQIAIPFSDKIIAVSEYDRQIALDKLIVSNNKIVTVYNGMRDVNSDFMANPLDNDPVNLVMVARFDHQKDQIELIKAAQTIDNVHIHFVGDGHLRKNAEKLVRDLDMEAKTTFWGELDNVDEILSKCQIFALISNWEGFPCSTLEAMRAGLPTVVSDVGGSAEAVDEGKTGYAVEKGDIENLTIVLNELVKSSLKRKEMGEAARKRFEALYTFDNMYEKTLAIYRDIYNQRESK